MISADPKKYAWSDQVLQPSDILKLSKTEEGKKWIKTYILASRTAQLVQTLFERLRPGEKMSALEHIVICEMVWQTLFRVPVDNDMVYASNVADALDKMGAEGFEC